MVAVCLLFSYLRPAHERRVREAVERALPEAAISVSHEVSPVWSEYERASTTIADAFVKPIVDAYVDRIGDELERGLGAEQWNLLASNGGYVRADAAHAKPAQLLLSGLAGGVTGARHFADAAGVRSAFTLDMGGTSCDIGLIADGVEQYAPEFDVAWGIPATIPCVSVKTIGAGGGSIAWVDRGGLLRVGPQSAGAEPGPGCLRAGWRRADAHGRQPRARTAQRRLLPRGPHATSTPRRRFAPTPGSASAWASTARQAARSALMIADEEMANAIRLVAVEQRPRPARLRARRVRRRRPAARPLGRLAARDRDPADPARPGPLLGASGR